MPSTGRSDTAHCFLLYCGLRRLRRRYVFIMIRDIDMKKLLMLLGIFVCICAHAEKNGCLDEKGKPYFSEEPCKPVTQDSANTIASSAYEKIEVFSAGYVEIGTITDTDKLSEVGKLLSESVTDGDKPEGIQQYFLLGYKGKKKERWRLYENGNVLYFNKEGGVVTKKYRIADPGRLQASAFASRSA